MTSFPILGPLFSLLECLAKFVVGGVIWAVVSAINLLFVALGSAVRALLSLLPAVPLPSVQLPGLLAWFDTWLPIHEAIALVPAVLALIAAWHLAQPLLRKFGIAG